MKKILIILFLLKVVSARELSLPFHLPINATFQGINESVGVYSYKGRCEMQGRGQKCPIGMCCSADDYCGNTSHYCAPLECQSQCPSPYPKGRCGWQAGGRKCSPRVCCNYYGWCGTTSIYCNPNVSCQSQCSGPFPKGRCGWQADGTPCPNGMCCSKYGWCGTTSDYYDSKPVTEPAISSRGHSKVDCNKLKYCTHCHKHGHLKDNCFQLIGYPANYKGKRLANNVSTDYGSLGSSNDRFGACSVSQFTPNQYNQAIVSDDDFQVPILTIKDDDHVCMDDHNDTTGHSIDHSIKEPHPQDQPTLSPPSVVEEPPMSSTAGRRQSTRTSRPPHWRKDFVTSAKSGSKSHYLYSLGDSIDYSCLHCQSQCKIPPPPPLPSLPPPPPSPSPSPPPPSPPPPSPPPPSPPPPLPSPLPPPSPSPEPPPPYPRCEKEGGDGKCKSDECCSIWSWCGTTSRYCAPQNCQSQCKKTLTSSVMINQMRGGLCR
ncbi:hypothetical protein H5410_018401 [Solanum commersonii]|uniref:Chitin-binding type-1 domain-containing protein n=1 Tax=Solanum commersonii TaxID=4109 RepID=A0A9J6A220_SOLCO|nr:hypothetical protein H5410_018401 [Solanum commersonii]